MSGNIKSGFGVNVWWTVPELIHDAKLAQAILAKHGCEPGWMRQPTKQTEVSRAVYSFQNLHVKDGRRKVEQVADNKANVVYGILERKRVDSEEVEFTQKTTVWLNKATDEVRVEGELANEVPGALQKYAGKVTDEDVRIFLRNIVNQCFGIPKRPSGGIYFIPAQFASVIQSAQAVLAEFQTGAKLYVEGVVDGEQERQNTWEAVEEEINKRIDDTVSAVERIERSTAAVKDHEEKLTGIKELMEVYKNLLGEEAKYEAVAEKLEGTVKVVSDKISQLQQGTAAKLVQSKPGKAAGPAKQEEEMSTKDNVWVKVAHEVLVKEGKPMHYKEITEKALKAGVETKGKTPALTMCTRLSQSIKNGDGLFKALGKGVYEVAS